jgi:hypothetical protein
LFPRAQGTDAGVIPAYTGDPLGTSGRAIVAENTIYHERAHPSHLILPIVP